MAEWFGVKNREGEIESVFPDFVSADAVREEREDDSPSGSPYSVVRLVVQEKDVGGGVD